jgi:small subunit ribosomal protein S4
VERRKYPPGEHGQRRSKLTDYAVQLREKQKVRNSYGLLEKQFKRYYEKASRAKGVTGEVLLQYLERRLDNIVYRMGFAYNRGQARQLVGHGHILVNGRRVNIPSFLVKPGDVVEVKESARNIPSIADSLQKAQHRGVLEWVQVDADAFKGTLDHIPSRDEIPLVAQEQLIVELYSK